MHYRQRLQGFLCFFPAFRALGRTSMTANAIIAPPLRAPLAAPLLQRLRQFPVHRVTTPLGQIAYRQSGALAKPTHVLLHGIGSSSANWLAQLKAAAQDPALCLLACGHGAGARCRHAVRQRQCRPGGGCAAGDGADQPGRVCPSSTHARRGRPVVGSGPFCNAIGEPRAGRQRQCRHHHAACGLPAGGCTRQRALHFAGCRGACVRR